MKYSKSTTKVIKDQRISQLSSEMVINAETHNGPQNRQWESSEYLVISEKPSTFLPQGPGIIVREGAKRVEEPEVITDDCREHCFLNKYGNWTDELKLLEIDPDITSQALFIFSLFYFPIW